MSKIFEVLKRDNAIDLAEIEPESGKAPNASVEEAARSGNGLAPSALIQVGRVVSLRVSAVAPIFPFSEEAHSAASEQYRIIRTKILHSAKKPRLIVVSGACTGDGKTITSINVAASLSLKASAPVLLVDTDLRRPRIAELLGIPSAPGLADVLCGRACLDEALVRTQEFPTLSILPAGEGMENAAELLDSDEWRGLILEIRSRFSHAIMDATPAAVVADYELLQHVADGVIVVVRPDHTDREACLSLLQSVPREKLIGAVLNCVEESWLWSTPGYYSYYGRNRDVSSRQATR
jgi:capsular exopolysaccharide synthesis family protein